MKGTRSQKKHNHIPSLSEDRALSGMEPGISLPQQITRHLDTLRNGKDIARWEAINSLTRIGQPAVPGLLTLLNGADGAARGSAAVALGRIGDARALPALLDALAMGDALTRRMAARSLGRLNHRDGVQPLIAALRDTEPAVRQDAAEALGWLGDTRATEPLIPHLNDPHPDIPPTVALALGRIGDARAAGALVAALEHSNSTYLRALRYALRRIHSRDAIPYLEPYCTHPHPRVQVTARDTIARLRRRRW